MHKDCADLRDTIVALHGRQARAPSRRFFLGLGVASLVIVGLLSTARPSIDAAFRKLPAFAKVTGGELTR